MQNDRDHRVDNLRAIGLLLLFLAHSQVSGLVNELRSFDVVMLVFLSGMMVKPERISSVKEYGSYVVKRIRQLLLPTYVAITAVILITCMLCFAIQRPQLFNSREILNSYLLCEESIGYVWIIKVYLFIAMAAPLNKWISEVCKSSVCFSIVLLLEYAMYELIKCLYIRFLGNSYVGWILIHEWLMTCLSFGIVGQCAYRYKVNEKWNKNFCSITAILFVVMQIWVIINGNGFSPSSDKRPVGAYYLSYGLLTTALLLKYMPNRKLRILEWLSQNSLHLYLLHIFFVMAIGMIGSKVSLLMDDKVFVIRFIIISLGTTASYWMAQKFIRVIKERFRK